MDQGLLPGTGEGGTQMSQSIVNVDIPLSPEELSAQHMKQQENYTEFLTPPEEQ